jgi:predicted RNase H-like nuclease
LGWLVSSAKLRGATFAPEEAQVCESFRNVLEVRPTFTIVVVNAPVGYLDNDTQGQRLCDQEARSLLGDNASAILNAPTRDALSLEEDRSTDGDDFLFDRYREVAREVAPSNQRVVYESNPELSFYQLNGFELLGSDVASVDGHAERRALLELKIPGIERVLDSELPEVTPRELRDVVALMWTARRVFGHSATRLPHDGVWDSEGLRMELVL